MTADAARSAPRDGENTVTEPCPGCTESSADRGSSVTSTKMRMIMEMNMASVKTACMERTVSNAGKHATVKQVDSVTEKLELVCLLNFWLKWPKLNPRKAKVMSWAQVTPDQIPTATDHPLVISSPLADSN